MMDYSRLSRPQSASSRVSKAPGFRDDLKRTPNLNDEWRLSVLDMLIVGEAYFTASQIVRMLRGFEFSGQRVLAAVRVSAGSIVYLLCCFGDCLNVTTHRMAIT